MSAFAEFVVQWAFPIAIVIILIAFAAREYFHSTYYFHYETEIGELQSDVSILHLGLKSSLHVLNMTMNEMEFRSGVQMSQMTYTELLAHSSSCYQAVQLSWDFLKDLHLGFLTSCFCSICICAVQIFEIRMIHPVTASGTERRFNAYIRNSYPVTTVLLHCVLLCSSIAAYLGLLDTRTYVVRCVDVLSLWYIYCTPISRVLHNIARLSMHYITFTIEDLSRRVKELQWWIWLGSATSGISDSYSLGCYVITTLAWLYFLHPYKYFVAHGWSNCSAASWLYSGAATGSYNHTAVLDQLAVSCAQSLVETLSSQTCEAGGIEVDTPADTCMSPHAVSNTSDPFVFPFGDIATSSVHTSTMEVFLCNMLIHGHILLIWYSSVRLLLHGTPPFSRNNRVLQWLRSKQIQAFWLMGIGINSVVCLIRVLIFLRYTGCMTWWGWCMAWMFVHMHIGLSISTLHLVLLLNEKTDFIAEHECAHVGVLMSQFATNSETYTKTTADAGADANAGAGADADECNDAFNPMSSYAAIPGAVRSDGPFNWLRSLENITDDDVVVDMDNEGLYVVVSGEAVDIKERACKVMATEVFHALLDRCIRNAVFEPSSADDSGSKEKDKNKDKEKEPTVRSLFHSALRSQLGVQPPNTSDSVNTTTSGD